VGKQLHVKHAGTTFAAIEGPKLTEVDSRHKIALLHYCNRGKSQGVHIPLYDTLGRGEVREKKRRRSLGGGAGSR
jgi:hypothetical protein